MTNKIIYIAVACVITTGCSQSAEKAPVEPDKVNVEIVNAGREAALNALKFDAESQQRDSALLQIRAIEQRLKAEGMPNSAKQFADGAQAVLDSILAE